jgi:hypothetical protein
MYISVTTKDHKSALSSSIVLLITTTEAEARGMALTKEERVGDSWM